MRKTTAIHDGKIRFVFIEMSWAFNQSESKGFEVPCITSQAETNLFTNGKVGHGDCTPDVGAQLKFLSIPEQYDLMGLQLPSVFDATRFVELPALFSTPELQHAIGASFHCQCATSFVVVAIVSSGVEF